MSADFVCGGSISPANFYTQQYCKYHVCDCSNFTKHTVDQRALISQYPHHNKDITPCTTLDTYAKNHRREAKSFSHDMIKYAQDYGIIPQINHT